VEAQAERRAGLLELPEKESIRTAFTSSSFSKKKLCPASPNSARAGPQRCWDPRRRFPRWGAAVRGCRRRSRSRSAAPRAPSTATTSRTGTPGAGCAGAPLFGPLLCAASRVIGITRAGPIRALGRLQHVWGGTGRRRGRARNLGAPQPYWVPRSHSLSQLDMIQLSDPRNPLVLFLLIHFAQPCRQEPRGVGGYPLLVSGSVCDDLEVAFPRTPRCSGSKNMTLAYAVRNRLVDSVLLPGSSNNRPGSARRLRRGSLDGIRGSEPLPRWGIVSAGAAGAAAGGWVRRWCVCPSPVLVRRLLRCSWLDEREWDGEARRGRDDPSLGTNMAPDARFAPGSCLSCIPRSGCIYSA
jgi:hypothetical protein